MTDYPMRFSLSARNKNTDILCSSCKHLVNGECDRPVTIDGFTYRLARLSLSGGECQLYERDRGFFTLPKWFDPETDYEITIQERRKKE